MAGLYPRTIVEPITEPQHFARPGARDLRKQAVHRLQVGLFGLGTMVLIVTLANVLMDRAQISARSDPIEDVVAIDAKPKKVVADPLADIGVVPATDPSPSPSDAAAGRRAPADGSSVNPNSKN